MFLTKEDQSLSEEYIKNGYLIRPVANRDALDLIQSRIVELSKDTLGITSKKDSSSFLNQIHEYVSVSQLNDFRLKMIGGINAIPEFRKNYFQVARPYLESLVGNELAMQLRINLSIQFPDDDSSLLPVHADTWSGDSPFEVVVWIPLVDCYSTKAMFLLPPEKNKKLKQNFVLNVGKNSETLFQSIESEVIWLELKYGEVLVFDQGLPHGNRVNTVTETRWSLNCRFKGLFTPYGDKKIGEFFEPITLRAASRNGMNYQHPETK